MLFVLALCKELDKGESRRGRGGITLKGLKRQLTSNPTRLFNQLRVSSSLTNRKSVKTGKPLLILSVEKAARVLEDYPLCEIWFVVPVDRRGYQ
jgi:hypothetical protein